nr:MAG TPA: hypothetical protein [Caudoviricetes sp.]
MRQAPWSLWLAGCSRWMPQHGVSFRVHMRGV